MENRDAAREIDTSSCVSFMGESVGQRFIQYIAGCLSTKEEACVYAHNASFDIRSCLLQLRGVQYSQVIFRGASQNIISINLTYNGKLIIVRDSYCHLSASLRDCGRSYGLGGVVKEVMPFWLLEESDAYGRVSCSKARLLEMMPQADVDQFLQNLIRWGCVLSQHGEEYKLDLYKYSLAYCKIDVIVLIRSLMKYRQTMLDLTSIDALEVLTCTSLGHRFMLEQGTYLGAYQLDAPQRKMVSCSLFVLVSYELYTK